MRTFVAWTFFILFYHPHNNDGTTPRLLEEDGEGEILCGKRAFRSFRFGPCHQWAEERARLCRVAPVMQRLHLSDTSSVRSKDNQCMPVRHAEPITYGYLRMASV
jgi:hypothetical protein